jgi:ABC-type lipoprotein release transport system permease subunit
MSLYQTIVLSCKYLFRYRRRYLFLFFALAFGLGIVSAISAIKASMTENVYESAQSHYAGDVVFQGWDKNAIGAHYHLDLKSVSNIMDVINESGIKIKQIVKRDMAMHRLVFFNGKTINLKYLIGTQWENESSYFKSLRYDAGSIENLNQDSIILSSQISKALGAEIGDNILVQTETLYGQINTGTFTLAATVNDSSIFGFYKAYLELDALNTLLGFEIGESSSVGIYLQNRADIDIANEKLQALLSARMTTAPLMHTRKDHAAVNIADWDDIGVFVFTIPVYLSEISQLIDALDLLIIFLYIMLLLIILVSAGVTYRLILHERTREIGTMRAIGFQERTVRSILITETLLMGTISIIAGLLLSLVFTGLASTVSFEWFPSFEIFLKDGKLGHLFAAQDVVFNIFAIYVVIFIAVFFPAYEASRSKIPEMLAGASKG